MCPRKSTLSAYYDGEVGEKMTEKIRLHLLGCKTCQATLDGFKRQSVLLKSVEEPRFDLSFEDLVRSIEPKSTLKVPTIPLWRRQVSIPLPALAAGLVFVFGGVFLWHLSLAQLSSPRGENLGAEPLRMQVLHPPTHVVTIPGGLDTVIPIVNPLEPRGEKGEVLIIKLPRGFHLEYRDPGEAEGDEEKEKSSQDKAGPI